VNKAELESKHLAELHALAAKAGIERYRALPRAELIERLAGGEGEAPKPGGEARRQAGGRRPRERGRRPREPRPEREGPRREREEPRREPERPSPAAGPPPAGERPKRRRRRRRWGRRRKEVRVRDLLLPPAGGRQAIVYAESREGCTVLLREIAADVSGGRGPDPVALLVDPSPEELADWKRDAPQAEIVSAGKAHHANDAIAQAVRRAESGEEVILLVDSLSRFAEAFGGGDEARELFDAGRAVAGNGSLTVVAAVERSS
jgi:Rho termination factor, N-terminal domain